MPQAPAHKPTANAAILVGEEVAALVGAHPMDVIFTSCATDSNDAAIAAALRHQFHFPAGPALPAAGTMKWSLSCHTGAAA
jgi:selenocysteine lyase/cysteine desulfurase